MRCEFRNLGLKVFLGRYEWNKFTNMDLKTTYGTLAVILLVILENISKVHSIKCYKCIIAPYVYYINGTVYKCKDFDYSEKFIVDCPQSTMCSKKVTNVKILDQSFVNGTERDCAFQTLNTQVYTNGHWQQETQIIEAYEEGCFKTDDKGFRTSNIEHCYCKGDLCNSSEQLRGVFTVIMVAVVGSVTRTLK